MFAGQIIAGGVVSTITITCKQVEEFPQSSVALQVRFSVYACGQDPETVASLIVIVGVASQLSVAVAVPVFAGSVLAEHSIVTLLGQDRTGAVLSSTKMVWMQVALFPQSSVAVQVRVMVLSCGQDPATVTSLKVNVKTASQLSVPVAVPVLAGNVLSEH